MDIHDIVICRSRVEHFNRRFYLKARIRGLSVLVIFSAKAVRNRKAENQGKNRTERDELTNPRSNRAFTILQNDSSNTAWQRGKVHRHHRLENARGLRHSFHFRRDFPCN